MSKPVPSPTSPPPDSARQPVRGERKVLALNAGSSSLKFALYREADPLARNFSGAIDRIGLPGSTFTLKDTNGRQIEHAEIPAPNHVGALEHLLRRLEEMDDDTTFASVGHRVVHGGPHYREPQIVDRAMLAELRRIRSFDPEHLPAEIALMEVFAEKFPGTPQVACFDTSFHRDMPRVAKLLPIPRRYATKGLERYGFHGLSYTYLMQELERVTGARAAKGRIILAHLGNGASMAAVRDGKSIDTTMAFTPAAGLVMSTRSGDLDPGLVTFLARSEGMTPPQFDHMVNRESGLLGVSETSPDMRDLLVRESEDVRAAEAVALFCYQVKKWIGAYAAALGGLDTLVFAGGIGEHASPVRARICAGLEFLGIELDAARNDAHADIISTANSRAEVRIIRTDEELMIARSVCRILPANAPKKGSIQ
ncbi:MAG TPA: acetate/propionate family kinase [Verrucomicrobiae bacterium]|jgi:acetate kinase|nr:acetate/propionate family kinase [Verrucomicrobiae bacterium]